MQKISEIIIKVHLDENRIPDKIEWTASDSSSEELKEAKSFMLSLWDKKENTTLGIDLWTKEMLVDDMNIHFHQVLLKMADTYKRATKNNEVPEMLNNFAFLFAEKLNLEKKTNKNQ